MQIRCPNCLVAFDSPEDYSWSEMSCPTCGKDFSLSGVETTCTYRPGYEVLGRFVLLEEVGAGRFGSVWKARDTQLERNVAVKIPRQRNLDPRETELFLRDARAAAQLKHPCIASVHEVGREGDMVYIVTDFIDGANLHEWLTGRRPSARESAELMIKVADAVHHAHDAGVVHRDLKPSNIMIDRRDEPYVIDFGLARREIGDMTMTVEGQVLGTPAYMSPEQARGEGHRADRRSDTYSLGVILFKLLTGELPFRGQARMLLLQILEHEPPNPRQLDATVPRDLATITLRCLEKDPAKRYQAAGELADDVKRFLAGEPIKARPVGRVERAWRWCKRHRAVASLSAALLLLLTAVSIVAPVVAVQQRRLRLEAERQVANNLFLRAGEEYQDGRIMEGIALLAGAYDVAGAEYALSGSIRQLMPAWSAEGGRPIVYGDAVTAAAFSPDGRSVLIGGHDLSSTAQLWDVETATPFGTKLQHADGVRAVAFSPDGRLAATGSEDGTARMWDPRSGAPARDPLRHSSGHSVWAIAFSPDGKLLATGGADGTAQIWEAKTGATFGGRLPHDDVVCSIAFSPVDRRIATACIDGTIRIWTFGTAPPDAPAVERKLEENAYAVDFSPDGTNLLIGTGARESRSPHNCARQYDATTLVPNGEPLRHDDLVYAVAFSPNGRTALTGSHDGTARRWDVTTGEPLGEPTRHGGPVMSVDFSPDGCAVLTASADGTVRLWNSNGGEKLSHDGGAIRAIAGSPNGRVAVTGGDDKTARLWDVRTGHPLSAPLQHDGAVWAVSFALDGKLILTGGDDGCVRLWNAEAPNAAREVWQFGAPVREIRCCADGKTALIIGGDESGHIVQIRKLATGKSLFEPTRVDTADVILNISPDGRTLLVRGADRKTWQTARLWDVASGRAKANSLHHETRITAASFSPDGRYVALGYYGQEVLVWDTQTGRAVGKPFRQNGVVNDVVFGSDGRTILSGGNDRKAWLWDVESGAALGNPLALPSNVTKVALSPNDTLALTICDDGSAQLWDVASCKLLARPLQSEFSVGAPIPEAGGSTGHVACLDGAFSADGSIILFRCGDGSVRLYKIPPPLPDDAGLIRTWARARSGFELDENGMPQQISRSEWLAAQRAVARDQGEP